MEKLVWFTVGYFNPYLGTPGMVTTPYILFLYTLTVTPLPNLPVPKPGMCNLTVVWTSG